MNRPFSLKNKIASTLSKSSRNLTTENFDNANNHSNYDRNSARNGRVGHDSLLAVEVNTNQTDNDTNNDEQSSAILYDNILDTIAVGIDKQIY